MAAEAFTRFSRIGDWIAENTQFDQIRGRIVDAPSEGVSAWARTTAGMVAFLFILQFLTGILMAFHYVPTAQSALVTVTYLEKVLTYGSWVRALHYQSSVLLPIALLAHVTQMVFRNVFGRDQTAWLFGIVLLALVLAAAATGYALPWDARALNGVNVAVSLTGNTPLIGSFAQAWLQNGPRISTLTLSRFYGLHVFAMPLLILLAISARFFFFGRNRQFDTADQGAWLRSQIVRNLVTVGALFIILAVSASWSPAELGPTAESASRYVPRPGPQFMWLFEMQKYTDGPLAALFALGFPAVILGALAALPLYLKARRIRPSALRFAVLAVLILGTGTVAALTGVAIFQDVSDPRVRKQIAKQEKEELRFRAAAFRPQIIRIGTRDIENDAGILQNQFSATADPKALPKAPAAYLTSCAKCHGSFGEGTRKSPPLVGVTTREEDVLSDEKLIEIINDAKAYGLSADMPPFKDKLTEPEKAEIVSFIRSLK